MRLQATLIGVTAAITGHTFATCQAILERYNVRTDKMTISAFQQRLEAEERAGKK